ncbi:MAG: hypothetical protein IKZ57_05140 [Spirochaetia bacterium]|nr:hypothetical protein [Spirochaetia bacterium]
MEGYKMKQNHFKNQVKAIIIILMFFLSFSVFGFTESKEIQIDNTNINEYVPSNNMNYIDERIQFAMLLNQIQYSLSAIVQTKDKEILTQQFDFIIDRIDRSKLKDRDITNTYEDLLETIKELTLSENEKSFVIEMNERKKKQAYTNALSSFGSVFNPGFSPITAITSLAYAGISAGLNIISAKNEADNELKEQLFHIDQKEINDIYNMYINLFGSDQAIIQKYNIDPKYRINNSQMDNFIIFLAEMNDNYPANIRNLVDINKNSIFSNFPIYWIQLGAQYQLNNQDEEAIKCYEKFKELKGNYSYLLYDPFYLAVAKNEIEIYKKQGIENNKTEIEKNLKIIEDNTLPQNEPENRIFMAGVYYELKQNETAKHLLQLNIDRKNNKNYIDYFDRSSEMLSLIEYDETKKLNKTDLSQSMIMELSSIKFKVNDEDKNLTLLIPKELGFNNFVYIIKDKIYPNIIPFGSNDNVLSFSNEIALKYDNPFEIVVGIANNKETIELYYECEFLKYNDNISKCFKAINYSIDDIEPCLLPFIFSKFSTFSYDPKEDDEYKNKRSENIRKGYTTPEQKKELENDLTRLEDDLNVRGPKRKAGEIFSIASRDLPNKKLFCSFLSKDKNNNTLVYSLKKVVKNSNSYTCNYYRGQPLKQENAKFKTEEINELKKLVISAMNNDKDAQYELAQVYDEPFSNTSKKYRTESIYFPGVFSPIFGIRSDYLTYRDWFGDEKDERNAIVNYWYKKAADNGNGHAAYIYANRLFNGKGIDKNLPRAEKYATKAINSDYSNNKSNDLLAKIKKQNK